MANSEKKKYRVGGILAGTTLTIENGFLKYKNVYGHAFRVPIQDITTVAVDDVGWGKAMLKIMGQGAELAKVKLPLPWANKAQEWILANK
ncbi:MAG TPA: hypothetical protein VHA78_05035 [Candidatus Peribacteraceae bacterium]|nr:hypothetical protein [Candidatus Peribacteraceae bacterium]